MSEPREEALIRYKAALREFGLCSGAIHERVWKGEEPTNDERLRERKAAAELAEARNALMIEWHNIRRL